MPIPKVHRSFGFCLLVAMPVGLVVGGAFGAISANLFSSGPGVHLEPMRGLIIGGGLAFVIGFGGAIAARFDLHK